MAKSSQAKSKSGTILVVVRYGAVYQVLSSNPDVSVHVLDLDDLASAYEEYSNIFEDEEEFLNMDEDDVIDAVSQEVGADTVVYE
jgi:hypothetical protein